MMAKWNKLEPFTGEIVQGCLNCPPVETIASMDMIIAVGFGSACVTCGNKIIYDEQTAIREGRELWTVQDAENAALKNPNHSWIIEMFGPLRGRTYQRQDINKWVLVDSNLGFA
jgi:hypothetical protein